jgi:mono/diheme cytochrome c family protein
MPGFKDHLSETQMWQVAVLVRNADKISPAVKAELTRGGAGEPHEPANSD